MCMFAYLGTLPGELQRGEGGEGPLCAWVVEAREAGGGEGAGGAAAGAGA